MPNITVLIPTYNHTDTIRRSIASVQNQSVQDFELFIVGDGAPNETDRIINDVRSEDGRIKYFRHKKDPAQGEVYRHQALQEAQGEIVCYLSDDDLWLPKHLETMQTILKEADFAHTLHVNVTPGGKITANGGDLSDKLTRDRMLYTKFNFFGLSFAGHTLSAYQQLPFGWRPRPEGVWCDLHMWRQWISQPWCQLKTEPLSTSLHFASPGRKDWDLKMRLKELDDWSIRLQDIEFPAWLNQQVINAWHRKIIVNPKNIFEDIANILIELKLWKEAEEYLKNALEIDNMRPGLHLKLINAQQKQGKVEQALNSVTFAYSLMPDDEGIKSLYNKLKGLVN